MNQYVAQLPWTDEQWARVTKTVKQEAERTRVAAKFACAIGQSLANSSVSGGTVGSSTSASGEASCASADWKIFGDTSPAATAAAMLPSTFRRVISFNEVRWSF